MEESFDFTKALSKHDKDENYKVLIQKYNTKSFFDIIGKGRSETMHSAFVGWLLSSKELVSSTGELSPLRSFLALLLSRCENLRENEYRKEVSDCITTALLSKSINNVNVETEKALTLSEVASKKSVIDKADIFVTFEVEKSKKNKYLILIENKVGSAEEGKKKVPKNYDGGEGQPIYDYCQKNQTERYYSIFTNEKWFNKAKPFNDYKDYQKIFVFLTPFYSVDNEYPEKGKEVSNDLHYININYQDLLEYCIMPLCESNYISNKNRLLLEEYIQCLSLSTQEEQDESKQEEIDEKEEEITEKQKAKKKESTIPVSQTYIVMASTEEEKVCLKKYYDANEPLILCAVRATFNKIKIDGVEQEVVDNNLERLKAFYERNKNLIMVAIKERNPDVYDDLFRDNTKFYFTDDDKKYGKGKFYYECVRRYIKENKKIGISNIEKKFNHPDDDMLQNGDYPIDRLNVVYGKVENNSIKISEKSLYMFRNDKVEFRNHNGQERKIGAFKLNLSENRYYKEPIKINNEDEEGFFVTTQWGDGAFRSFWNWAKDKIGGVKSNNNKLYPNNRKNESL